MPPDSVAAFALPLLGAAVGRSRAAVVKRTFRKPPLLWTALIAPPSAGKSPALALAAAPVWKAEGEWRAASGAELTDYERSRAEYKAAEKAWRDGGCEGDPPVKPVRPTLRQVVPDDTAALAGRMNALDADDPFRATLGKLRECGLRLAALVWCLRHAAGEVVRDAPIDAETMGRAAELVDCFEAHARRCHGRGVTDKAGRVARRLVRWLADAPALGAFTRSQAYQQLKGQRDVRNGDALNAPLALLVDHGFIRVVPDAGGGRPCARASSGRCPAPGRRCSGWRTWTPGCTAATDVEASLSPTFISP